MKEREKFEEREKYGGIRRDEDNQLRKKKWAVFMLVMMIARPSLQSVDVYCSGSGMLSPIDVKPPWKYKSKSGHL